jgi:hypothetical protein
MRWNIAARARLAKVIWEKSRQIDEEVMASNNNLRDYTRERDWRIPAYFEGLGFRRATAEEWHYDRSSNHPTLFKPGRSHLHFLICNQVVLRIHKDKAAKMLVLGLP